MSNWAKQKVKEWVWGDKIVDVEFVDIIDADGAEGVALYYVWVRYEDE